jgi:hypothetical protein
LLSLGIGGKIALWESLRAGLGKQVPRVRLIMADDSELSEEEIALLVALQQGQKPRLEDPLCLALEARGLVRIDDESAVLTPAGEGYGRD